MSCIRDGAENWVISKSDALAAGAAFCSCGELARFVG
jgi:hypothetical protein